MSFICILSLVNLLPSGRLFLQAELHFRISSTTELNSLCLIFWKCSSLAFIFRSMLLFFNMEAEADRAHFAMIKMPSFPRQLLAHSALTDIAFASD